MTSSWPRRVRRARRARLPRHRRRCSQRLPGAPPSGRPRAGRPAWNVPGAGRGETCCDRRPIRGGRRREVRDQRRTDPGTDAPHRRVHRRGGSQPARHRRVVPGGRGRVGRPGEHARPRPAGRRDPAAGPRTGRDALRIGDRTRLGAADAHAGGARRTGRGAPAPAAPGRRGPTRTVRTSGGPRPRRGARCSAIVADAQAPRASARNARAAANERSSARWS